MRLHELSARIDQLFSDSNGDDIFQLADEVAEFFRDSFADLKTVDLNNEECLEFEKCLLFVEYYLIHLGKSKFLFFILLDMINGDNRFDLIRCRLKLMDYANKVNNIQSGWMPALNEIVLCSNELSQYGQVGILSNTSQEVFFDRALITALLDIRKMLRQISEENNFMPHLFDLVMKDGIVAQKLGLRIMQLSTSPENIFDLFDFYKN